MSKKALVLAVFFVLVVFRGPALAASGSNTFAHAWNAYSQQEKKSFLFGLATAVRIVCTDVSSVKKNTPPQEIEKHFRDCFNAYAGVDPNQVIAAMNDLYADSKNAMIPIDGAYKIALMQVRGDKVDQIIIQSRKYGENLKKELDRERKGGRP